MLGIDSAHEQEIKEVYDKHARLMEHERSAVVGVGHGMWYFDDMVGTTTTDKDKDDPKRRTSH